MDYKELTNLIKMIDRSKLSEFKLKQGDLEISIKTDRYSKGSKEVRPVQLQAPVVAPAPSYAPMEVPQNPAPTVAPAPIATSASEEVSNDNLLEIRSPIVGTFYRSSSPDKPPFVKVGDAIETGSVVCIVEAMKLFNEIESEISGKIVKVVVEDATPVEYDQVLFLVDPQA